MEPVEIDLGLEERMLELRANMNKKRVRAKRLAVVMALILVSCTGFVAMGGDRVVLNYISPSTELDEEGNPLPHDFSWGKWFHKIHDHVWEHFHGPRASD